MGFLGKTSVYTLHDHGSLRMNNVLRIPVLKADLTIFNLQGEKIGSDIYFVKRTTLDHFAVRLPAVSQWCQWDFTLASCLSKNSHEK